MSKPTKKEKRAIKKPCQFCGKKVEGSGYVSNDGKNAHRECLMKALEGES